MPWASLLSRAWSTHCTASGGRGVTVDLQVIWTGETQTHTDFVARAMVYELPSTSAQLSARRWGRSAIRFASRSRFPAKTTSTTKFNGRRLPNMSTAF